MTSAIRLNHFAKEILISKTFQKAAMNPNSMEYKDLAEVMEKHPDYKITQRGIKECTHKDTYKGLTYEYMRDYIILTSTKEEEAKNLAALEERLAEACTALKVAPDALMCETPSRLDLIREKAAVELGKELKKNEALLHADYDLTLREIRRRLKAELRKPENNSEQKENNARPKERA